MKTLALALLVHLSLLTPFAVAEASSHPSMARPTPLPEGDDKKDDKKDDEGDEEDYRGLSQRAR